MLDIMRNIAITGVILICTVSLIFWGMGHVTISKFLPGLPDVEFNTALSLLFIALAFILSKLDQLENVPIRFIVGVIIGLFALLSLSQDIFSINIGIDNIFFDSHAHAYGHNGPHPGRMSPITAVGVLLIALIVFILPSNTKSAKLSNIGELGMLLMMAMLLTVSVAELGIKLFAEQSPAFLSHAAPIPPLTAILMILMAIGLVAEYLMMVNNNRDTHPR